MKKTRLFSLLLALCLLCGAALPAPAGAAAADDGIAFSSITNFTDVGQTRTLTVSLTGDNAGKQVRWASTNTSAVQIQSVSADTYTVTLKSVGTGTATITASVVGTVRGGTYSVSVTADVTDIELENMTIYVWQTKSIPRTITPSYATNTSSIEWTSNDPSIATVSGGSVTGRAPGKVTITAQIGSIKATCEVTVIQSVESITIRNADTHQPISRVVLDGDTTPADSIPIEVVVYPSTANDTTIVWEELVGDSVSLKTDPTPQKDSSSNTVTYTGTVTAKQPGDTTISAHATANKSLRASCVFHVTHTEPTDVLILTPDDSPLSALTVSAGVEFNLSELLHVEVTKSTAYPGVKWSVDHSGVAEIADGKLRTYKPGTAVFTATALLESGAESTISNSFTLTTVPLDISVTATTADPNRESGTITGTVSEGDTLTVYKNGDPANLTAAVTVTPANVTADYGGILWCKGASSTPGSSFSISPTDVDPAQTNGATASYTVKAGKYPSPTGQEATLNFNVKVSEIKATSVTIRDRDGKAEVKLYSLDVLAEPTVILYADVQPPRTTNKKVKWSSSDDAVATVAPAPDMDPEGFDRYAIVTAKKAQADPIIIYVDTEDGSKCHAHASFTVTENAVLVNKLVLDPKPLQFDDADLKSASSKTLTATISAKDANLSNDIYKKDVTWTITSSEQGAPEIISLTGPDGNGVTGGSTRQSVQVVPLAPGEVTVTATSASPGEGGTENPHDSCVVTVSGVAVSSGGVRSSAVSVPLGGTLELGTIAYGSVKDKSAKWLWTSSDPNTARVDADSGVVSGVKVGSTTVTCRYADWTAQVAVTVYDDNDADVIKRTMTGDRYCMSGAASGAVPSMTSLSLAKTGAALEYVTGMEASPAQGTLYYSFVGEPDTGAGVGGADKFYLSSGNTSVKLLKNVYFVPKPGFTGVAVINFTGFGVSQGGRSPSYAGTVHLTVTPSSTISYISLNGEAINLRADDFTNYCKAKYGYTVSSVRFTAPDSKYGLLYTGYSGEEIYSSNVKSDARFYVNSTPSINTLWFVPRDGYVGTFNMNFEMVHSGSSSPVSGVVQITVNSLSGNTVEDISYTAYVGERAYLSPDDFYRACQSAGLGTLNYVNFASLPNSSSQGKTYHGTTQITSGNYYYSSTNHANNYLGSVNFLPSATGKVRIPFTAYDASGKSVSGAVVFNVLDGAGRASTISYETNGMPVTFTRSDFVNACKKALPGELASVSFTQPGVYSGRLYESFQDLHNNKLLADGASVAAADLIKTTFVPRGGATSNYTSIYYTAKDAGGNSCSGTVSVHVTPNTSSQYFKDVDKYGWACQALDFLRAFDVVTGRTETTYAPGASITRGDFTLMLYRAFNFPNYGTSSFTDVPENSYYAVAIAAAKARDIVSGTNGRFRPREPITRQDAAVMLYRALQAKGEDPATSSSYLNIFSDGSTVSGYARDAMNAMVGLGVFRGDNGKLKPKGTLTRAEMAVILYRAIT